MYPDDDDGSSGGVGVGGGGGGGGGIDGVSSDDGYDTSNMMDWGIRRKEKDCIASTIARAFVLCYVYIVYVLCILCIRTLRFSFIIIIILNRILILQIFSTYFVVEI